jgi:hypothetical protein
MKENKIEPSTIHQISIHEGFAICPREETVHVNRKTYKEKLKIKTY